MKRVQSLVDAHPEITRLYTTLSADEMTLDPLFAFNPDQPDVSNVHTAERTIECNPGVYQSEAPWRIALPQGGTVWGTAADANAGTWPAELSTQPPNRVIARTSASGQGKVIEDNSEAIASQLATYNAGKSAQPGTGGCAAGRGRHSSGMLLAAALFGAAVVRRRRRLQRGSRSC
jgi:MYXO-CTERM domain-containing protein